MKLCTQCGEVYPSQATTCSADGTALKPWSRDVTFAGSDSSATGKQSKHALARPSAEAVDDSQITTHQEPLPEHTEVETKLGLRHKPQGKGQLGTSVGSEVATDVTVGGSWDECANDEECSVVGEICSAARCGRPVSPSESYELATNNYIAGGGSGFAVLENNTTQEDSGISMRDAVRFYMLELSAGNTIPLNQSYPGGDGRITPRF